MDWQIGDELADWSRIEIGLTWIGDGLTLDWWIGTGLTLDSRIGDGLADCC